MDVLVDPRPGELTRTLRMLLDGAVRPPLAVLTNPSRARSITQQLDDVDVILATSGSTDGNGHLVGLGIGALTASAAATHSRLSGPGRWLATLPTHHVAGFQVAFRSAVAGTTPIEVPRWDDVDALSAAVDSHRPGLPLYASLVPAQLRALVASAPTVLARLDAVLVGGAALSAPIAQRAEAAGIRVVRTYGMTETCGGCVYDGVPLDGVRVRIEGGLVQVGGPTLMTRYLDADSQPFADDGKWLTTADLGEWDARGRLHVTGRADDVIVSGGVNVAPRIVEEALEGVLGGAWAVIGLPDEKWGQRVVAVTGDSRISLDDVRSATTHLEPAFRPREIVVEQLPRTSLGKLDRHTLRERLAGGAVHRMGHHGHHL